MTFYTPSDIARAKAPTRLSLIDLDWSPDRIEQKRRAKLDRYEEVWTEVSTRLPGRPRLGQVESLVARVVEITGIPRHEIFSTSRKRIVSWTRQGIYALIRKRWPNYSTQEIGRKFNCDHTSVVFAWQKYNDHKSNYVTRIPERRRREFREHVANIEQQLYERPMQ